jgi:hypothetical protein
MCVKGVRHVTRTRISSSTFTKIGGLELVLDLMRSAGRDNLVSYADPAQ